MQPSDLVHDRDIIDELTLVHNFKLESDLDHNDFVQREHYQLLAYLACDLLQVALDVPLLAEVADQSLVWLVVGIVALLLDGAIVVDADHPVGVVIKE